jgi:hypothetical protein
LELSLSDLFENALKRIGGERQRGVAFLCRVPIQEVLAMAKFLLGKELHGKENLSKYVLVKSADGYQVLFSLAELDASVQDKNVLLPIL